jgi:hypothetical protein
MLSPDSGELGRSSDITDDSRLCREARELKVLRESFSPARNLPSSPVFRLSDLCLDREKKDDIVTSVDIAAAVQPYHGGCFCLRDFFSKLGSECGTRASCRKAVGGTDFGGSAVNRLDGVSDQGWIASCFPWSGLH